MCVYRGPFLARGARRIASASAKLARALPYDCLMEWFAIMNMLSI